MKRVILAFTILFLLLSCTTDPKPIVYGTDECKFCMMKIMDQRFGAEVITEKGKIYTFDSVECMLQYLNENTETVHQNLLVTHISDPNILQDATNSYYVVSENIPSPMGGNLSSYNSKEEARATVKKDGGEVYSWKNILEVYSTP